MPVAYCSLLIDIPSARGGFWFWSRWCAILSIVIDHLHCSLQMKLQLKHGWVGGHHPWGRRAGCPLIIPARRGENHSDKHSDPIPWSPTADVEGWALSLPLQSDNLNPTHNTGSSGSQWLALELQRHLSSTGIWATWTSPLWPSPVLMLLNTLSSASMLKSPLLTPWVPKIFSVTTALEQSPSLASCLASRANT